MNIKEPNVSADYSMIWMHGLGADFHDMAGVVQQMGIEDLPIRHVFLQAPIRPITINNGYQMPGWYDIAAMSLIEQQDKAGILASEMLIKDAIKQECDKGIQPSNILLSGFSQGGAMALFTGLRLQTSLAGVVALSAYLPLDSDFTDAVPHEKINMPVFMGHGRHDPMVLPGWSELSIKKMKELGISNIKSHIYPMEHSICLEEIMDLKAWLTSEVLA